jgi:sterol O-acyltransferase
MIMKVHSYCNVNGYLSHVYKQARKTLQRLEKATESIGGWEKALSDAKLHREAAATTTSSDTSDVGTPPIPNGLQGSYVDATAISDLRRRLVTVSAGAVNETGTREDTKSSAEQSSAPTPHPLVDHPSEEISGLAQELTDLESELISQGPHYVTWPENITFKNFAVYQLIPSLVYELEYPRTNR